MKRRANESYYVLVITELEVVPVARISVECFHQSMSLLDEKYPDKLQELYPHDRKIVILPLLKN